MAKCRIAVVHPRLGWGGSEIKTLWALELLKHDYDVHLITSGHVDLPCLNRYYGTDLHPAEISVVQVPLPFFLRRTARFNALRGHFVEKFCKGVAGNFDLMICMYSPMDFGVRGIQFVADFSFDEELRRALHPLPDGPRGWWYRDSLLRSVYLRLCKAISHSSPDGWKKNLTLVTSSWSAKLMRERYGIEARTLYPPALDDFPAIPYQKRENGFVCIGRLAPEKRIDTVIEILSIVRRRGHDIHLHILGGIEDGQYARALKELCRKHRGWVFLEGQVGGQRKRDLIAKHRFGIHACRNEAIGNAVIELAKGGCIVFTPNGGGQVEIVDHPDLVYSDEDDAVLKIERVLESAPMQEGLRRHLSRAGERFSVENFQRGIRDAVAEFLLEKQDGGGVAIHAEAHA